MRIYIREQETTLIVSCREIGINILMVRDGGIEPKIVGGYGIEKRLCLGPSAKTERDNSLFKINILSLDLHNLRQRVLLC